MFRPDGALAQQRTRGQDVVLNLSPPEQSKKNQQQQEQ